MSHPIFVVDVFAESRYAGNQLAVITEAGDLSTETMQAVSRETNFSETTFVTASEPNERGWPVRIFTPATELPFAGHPTLGTSDVIRRELLGRTGDPEPGEALTLDLKIGPIPVTFERVPGEAPVVWMRQNPPTFGGTAPAEAAAVSVGLSPADLDARFPIQVVSTGVPFLIVPVSSLEAVRRARLDVARYRAAIEALEAKLILYFCPETEDPANQLHARVFCEYVGVPEDPATGSANGCLAAYLAEHRYFGSGQVEAKVEQGYEMGRPSILRLRSDAASQPFRVEVGGRVVPTIRGQLEG